MARPCSTRSASGSRRTTVVRSPQVRPRTAAGSGRHRRADSRALTRSGLGGRGAFIIQGVLERGGLDQAP